MAKDALEIKDERRKTCFVVGPIGNEGTDIRMHADWLLDGVIKPVLAEFKEFQAPVRADTIASPGLIDTQIIEQLLSADLVIADLSYLNPNAFYELGIRHVIEKPIIHVQLKTEALPFDVGGFRTIKFSLRHPSDITTVKGELKKAIAEAVHAEHRVETPVTHARGRLKLEESATPADRVFMEEIRALRSRVSQLEQKSDDERPSTKTASEEEVSTGNSMFIIEYDAKKIGASEISRLAKEIAFSKFPNREWEVFGGTGSNGATIILHTTEPSSRSDYLTVRSLLEKIPSVKSVI